ncbi:hypothetical protein Tco_0995487 [Tanacetum coccineum]
MDICDEIRLSKYDPLPKSSSMRDSDQNKHPNNLSGEGQRRRYFKYKQQNAVKDKADVVKAPVAKDNDKDDVVKAHVTKDKDKANVVKDKPTNVVKEMLDVW